METQPVTSKTELHVRSRTPNPNRVARLNQVLNQHGYFSSRRRTLLETQDRQRLHDMADLNANYHTQLQQTGICMLKNWRQKEDTTRLLRQISSKLNRISLISTDLYLLIVTLE